MVRVRENLDDGVEGGSAPTSRQTSKLRKRSAAYALGAVVLAAGGIGLYLSRADQSAARAQPLPAHEVTVIRPLVRNMETQLGFLGQFSAVDEVELRPQVGGILTGIRFRDGDVVKKGDLLFTIDPVPYQISLSRAEALLKTAQARQLLAKQELARAEELQRSDAGTLQNVQQKVAELDAANAAQQDASAQIRDARFDLDHCRIVAPFTGKIGRHRVSVGNLIAGSRAATSPTTLLATMVSLDPIYFDFDMSEADYQGFMASRADAGGPLSNGVVLSTAGESSYNRAGKLDFIDNVLDRRSGTIHARATVANSRLDLTPGQFARVRLGVGQALPAMLLPDAAVIPDQSDYLVMTVGNDGTVIPRHVKVGEVRDGLRVIRSGLAADERVVVGGLPYASPGSKVVARNGDVAAIAATH
ncbi:efflux RND transporter periplasmic adaptor subunit [Paraburkholderia strydomiana]|uniref:efflux RND transporter periplasmic adaptor subunit n=1 Tax=Paraburkholderia strydomiana TaxID=1245417 RepID=UPI0035B558B0